MVSGRRSNFEISPPISGGAKLRIAIKENKEGFEFGLIPAVEAVKRDYSYRATMFNSEAITYVKEFKVCVASGEFKATAVPTNGTDKPLDNTRTKHYRESDRINLKEKIGVVTDIVGIGTNIGTAAAGF